ncbi:MAG TPA: DUF4097 family beta strand repeat-containing protein [Candidatus Acidoferrales bacterium]|nr:DUF4097 family beta strand repeat-containing protein [Candidatus Acidoferrales bacterium]
MIRPCERAGLAAAAFTATTLLACCLAGCGPASSAYGVADRTFTVTGPVRLELTNGSGNAHIAAGPVGEVRVHAEFHVHAWPWENAQRKLEEVESDPPISQKNGLVRVGGPGWRWNDMVSADYAITVPQDTDMRAVCGSGSVDVNGIHGPANFTIGSGSISATGIADDTRAMVGSGDVRLIDIGGQIDASAGSGNIEIEGAKGEVRAHAGSGNVRIERPSDNVVANTGSGNLEVRDATAELRLRTGSGNITIDGNPKSAEYWDLRSGSGDVTLHVPSGSSFRFYARSGSGEINLGIPAITEGSSSKHDLSARIGSGDARVEVQTSSGTISLH